MTTVYTISIICRSSNHFQEFTEFPPYYFLQPISVQRGGAKALVEVMHQSFTIQTGMATALCGPPASGRNSKPAKTHGEQRRKTKDSRRREAALLFLNNISLDGRPQCQPSDGNSHEKVAEEHRLSDRDGGASIAPQPAAGSHRPLSQVTDPAAPSGGSSSSFPGMVTPTQLSSVMFPGFAGANEVFLEGGSGADTLTPDTITILAPTGHQLCSRVRSTPAAVSPVSAGNSLDSRQR